MDIPLVQFFCLFVCFFVGVGGCGAVFCKGIFF